MVQYVSVGSEYWSINTEDIKITLTVLSPPTQQLQAQIQQLQAQIQQLQAQNQQLQAQNQQLQAQNQQLQAQNQQLRIQVRWFQRGFWLLLTFFIIAVVFIIALSVPGGILQKKFTKPTTPGVLNVTTPPVTNKLPVIDSGLGAAYLALSNYFSPPSPDGFETKLVYNGGDGQLCIRSKTGSTWKNIVQCVDDVVVNPKPNTPLTMLDWIGGPSFFFLTTENCLSGVNYSPQNDTWTLSSISKYQIKAHDQSQLASVAWLNGTSAWVHYQDPEGQIREFGIDDYRNQLWRDGSVGPLSPAMAGSGIGVCRWLNVTSEVEEIFFQVANGAIHARMYAKNAWLPNIYTIPETIDNVPQGASISAATVNSRARSTVLLTYVAKSGFVSGQTRGTMDASDFDAFSSPNKLAEGSGHPRTGLAVVGSSDAAWIYFVNGQKTLALSSDNVTTANWTKNEI
jgi:hypothetical protein